MSEQKRPPPLVSPEVDLRDFDFMPLHVVRLRDSDLVVYSSGDEFKAAVLLWSAAWHQVPAGTLPADDRWLAKHSGAGLGWKKLRAGALRGWIECSDGRLHHDVLAEVALASWRKKLEQRGKTLKARIAAAEKRLRDAVTAVDKSQSQALLDGLLHELSQINARPVTANVTGSKSPPSEVKGSEVVLPSVVSNSQQNARATKNGHNALEGRKNGKTERWDASDEGIDAKGRELGLRPNPGETYFDFKGRLWAEINERSRASA